MDGAETPDALTARIEQDVVAAVVAHHLPSEQRLVSGDGEGWAESYAELMGSAPVCDVFHSHRAELLQGLALEGINADELKNLESWCGEKAGQNVAALVGPSGSGKSVLLASLAAALGPRALLLAHFANQPPCFDSARVLLRQQSFALA